MGRRILLILTVTILLWITPGWAKKPRTTFDKSVEFSQYKTYAWVTGTAAPDAVVNTIIIQAVDYELQHAGLQLAPANIADLLIRYDVAGGTQASSAASDPTYAASGGYAPITSTALWTTGDAVDIRTKGSLCVQLMDQASTRIIWTSVAQAGLDSRRVKRIEQVNQVIEQMFKEFPKKK